MSGARGNAIKHQKLFVITRKNLTQDEISDVDLAKERAYLRVRHRHIVISQKRHQLYANIILHDYCLHNSSRIIFTVIGDEWGEDESDYVKSRAPQRNYSNTVRVTASWRLGELVKWVEGIGIVCVRVRVSIPYASLDRRIKMIKRVEAVGIKSPGDS